MTDDNRRGNENGDVPGVAFHNLFVAMEELIDKLKLLEYEREFCKENKIKPFSRHFFALQTNPGEQFYAFTSAATWLLNVCGRNCEMPQEYDDPNATISDILDETRKLGVPTDFPPSKLKPGYGEQVVYILSKLAEEALKAQAFSWKRPFYAEEDDEEETEVQDDAELTMDKLNEELQDEAEEDIDEEDSFLDLATLKQQSYAKDAGNRNKLDSTMLTSATDSVEWRLELERVLPHLKVHIKVDNKDWRHHHSQMIQLKGNIDTSLTETQEQLSKLHSEISKTLEKIDSREKYINNQLEHLVQDYRSNQDQLAQAKEKYKQSSGGVTELTQKLAQITDELEQVKQQMDERGTNMTDAGPLVRIKQALARLKTEISHMDIRTGVVEQSLQQARLREKRDIEKSVAGKTDEGGGGFIDYNGY